MKESRHSQYRRWMNLTFLATIAALLPTIAPTTLMRTVAEGADSPIHERTDVVVKTPNEWKALLTRFAPARTPEPVDFEREMIVGVFVGPRPSTGYVPKCSVWRVRAGPSSSSIESSLQRKTL